MNQKIKIIITFSIFMLFIKASNAQSFLTQDKLWSDYYYTDHYDLYAEDGTYLGWTTAKITSWHKVGTDSLIDGTLYKQILTSRDSSMEKWDFDALMREDGNKVFRYNPNGKSEFLLYDFGMQPGDTLFDVNGYVATVLQSVRDTVMDRTRKLFTFSKYEYDYDSQEYGSYVEVSETWIEGIGALRGGLFRPLYDFSTVGDEYSIGYRGLICYFENGEPVYHNADYDQCYYNEIKPLPGVYIPEVKVQTCVLTQNAPNPFTNRTEIKCFVENDVEEAYICIFNMQGKMLRRISVTPGQNNITIKDGALQAGIYLYSLICDGKVVDTRRMILTK